MKEKTKMKNDNMGKYRILVETIKLVASSPNIQLSAIPEQACRPDEIAFSVEDILPLLKDLTENRMITATISSKIKEIDRMFRSFERQDWTETALKESSKWAEIRAAAAKILELMGEKVEPPDLFWIRDIF